MKTTPFKNPLTLKRILLVIGLLAIVTFVLGFVKNTIQPSVPTIGLEPQSKLAVGGRSASFNSVGSTAGFAADTAEMSRGQASIAPMPPKGTIPDSAESLEATDYTAQIKSRNLENDCQRIQSLKSRGDVVFENSNNADTYCSFSFKVEKAQVQQILEVIRSLNPDTLSENTQSISKAIESYASEEEILKAKLASIDETLESGIAAYDQITKLATGTQNAEALAKIIDSKLQLIERLTQSRLETAKQLEQITKFKNEQLGRTDYTYFYVSIQENKIINWKNIGASWRYSLDTFITRISNALQGVTLGLVAFLIIVLQYTLYALILIAIARLIWRAIRSHWN